MVGLNATSVLVPKPEVKANITKESAMTYKVTITDVPIYIADIQVPTWTEANGQDDLQWYKAEKAADGSYYVVFSEATHNLEAGTYNVHVYGYNHVKKVQTGLLGKRFESDYRFGDVAVKAELAPTGIYNTMPSDVSSNLKTYHTVWSAKTAKMISSGTRQKKQQTAATLTLSTRKIITLNQATTTFTFMVSAK